MKNTKKFAAMIAALTLSACSIAPMASFAAENVKISVKTDGSTSNEVTNQTPNADQVTHTYTAYQIFTGEYKKIKDAVGEEGDENYKAAEYQFDITGLGSNATGLLNNEAFLGFKKDDTSKTVEEYINGLGDSATNAQKAAAAAKALDGIVNGSEAANNLAKILSKVISGDGTVITGDNTSLAEGYYLIIDTYVNETNKNDAVSKFILKVNSAENSNGITIVPKKSYPTVIKKVQENAKTVLTDWADGTATTLESNVTTADKWNDVADYNIGDEVPFQLYGSLPATLDDYESYYYLFTDTLGTQFDQPEKVTVKVGSKTLTFTLTNSATGTGKVYTLPTDDQLDWEYTEGATAKVTTTDGNCRVKWDNNKLYVAFENIKAYGVNSTSVITVEYKAKLNDTAKIGLDGQENKVDLTYSNNPNFEYKPDTNTPNKPDIPEIPNTPDIPENPDVPNTPPEQPEKPNTPDSPTPPTDKTPEDKVVVFTYEIDINKIDGTTKKNLSGAKFTLKSGNNYAIVDTETGKLTGWTTTASEATTLTSDTDGLFKIIGLDSGTYTLTETEAPAGYNLPANSNFEIVLTATTVNTQQYTSTEYATAGKVLTGIAGTINGTAMTPLDEDVNRGVEGTIENNKGTTLPSTGGMGTALFYLGGGCMAGLAGIYLISKKRTDKEN